MVPNKHSHDHHSGHQEEHSDAEIEEHRKHIIPLRGCRYIIVRALGPNMKDALELENIQPLKVTKDDGNSAGEILDRYISGQLD